VDAARTEAADTELSRMIERRSRKGEIRPDELEPLYMEKVRRHNARRQEEHRRAWAAFHEDQAERHRRTLQDLVEHHQKQAAKLMEVRPEGAA
jgi:hypothetical protein